MEAAALSAAISLVEYFYPKVREAFKRGEISKEEQAALMDRLNKLRGDELFSGEEWKV